MDTFIFSIKALLPIFIPIALGYFVRFSKIIDTRSFGQMNAMIFKTLLPLLIFMNIYNAQVDFSAAGPSLLFALAGVLLIFFISWWGTARLVRERRMRGMIIQGLFRSNFVLFGVPLSTLLLAGKSSGLTEILIAVVVPLFNVLAVFILSFYSDSRCDARSVARQIAKNPLILASLAALLAKQLGLQLPSMLSASLSGLAATATPLALLVLGGEFYFSSGARYWRYLLPSLLLRLLIFPLALLWLAYRLHFGSEAMVTFLAIFASPTAVSSYTMARQMCPDAEYAAQFLVYSSVLCLFTLFGFISAGHLLGLI